jgi:dienelactone hydrolase
MAAVRPSLLLLAALAIAPIARAGEAPAAPAYPHKSVTKREIGAGPQSYFLFEPAEPTPKRAPVVVFHHGWLAMNPGVYGAWIEHLVREGHIVIYPRFMEVETPVTEYLSNSATAVVDAFGVLETSPAHVKPDRSRFALIGHSTGGMLSVQMAAQAKSLALPEPKAVVAVTPGEVLRTKGPNLADVPHETLLVVVAAEHDVVTGDGDARRIYRDATSLPPSRKKFVLYRTDLRGRPRLWADHLAPTASHADFDTGDGPFRLIQMSGGSVNAIDREGFWKVADVTLSAGFAGKTLDEALTGVSFRLGYWSDGRPVQPPIITNDPTTLPRVVPAHGLRLIPFSAIEFPKRDETRPDDR